MSIGKTTNFYPSSKKDRVETLTKDNMIANKLIRNDTNTASLSRKKTPLPNDLIKENKQDEKWYKNLVLPLIFAPLLLLGAVAGLSKIYKTSLINEKNITKDYLLPNIGRIITINDDNQLVLYLLVHEPTKKNLFAAVGVFVASITAFLMKNTFDGIKQIWFKKQQANINYEKEKKLISIKTRCFSGKNQITRNLLEQAAEELNLNIPQINKPKTDCFKTFKNFILPTSFKGQNNKISTDEKNTPSKKPLLNSALALIAIGLGIILTRSTFKNIGAIAKHIEKIKGEAEKSIKKDFVKIPEEEINKMLLESNMSDDAKLFIMKQWKKFNNKDSILDSAPEYNWGTHGKTSFSSVVTDTTSFIYTYIINPTPQTRNLAILLGSSAGIGYVGGKSLETFKEVQIEKANAKTEIDFQDKLVQVELKNFYEKKKSYIQPLMDDYRQKLKLPYTAEQLKRIKENILLEIKNGPPFVY